MKQIKVEFKKVDSHAKMPVKIYKGDICYDIHSNMDVELKPHTPVMINTGICVNPEAGYGLEIRGRSGISSKGIICLGGEIDNGYRGEIRVLLLNATGQKGVFISKGERVAQIKPIEIVGIEWIEVDEMHDNTDRSINGFGSTGKN
jgi:dUTP pyrophosphatase